MLIHNPKCEKDLTKSRKSTFKQKIGDGILIIAIIAAAVLSISLASGQNNGPTAAYAVVEVNGKESLRIALGEKQAVRIFTVDGFRGKSRIEVKDGKVRMLESDCPDKLCVGMGWAEKTGDSIVCVPNRVVIKMTGPTEKKNVDTITE